MYTSKSELGWCIYWAFVVSMLLLCRSTLAQTNGDQHLSENERMVTQSVKTPEGNQQVTKKTQPDERDRSDETDIFGGDERDRSDETDIFGGESECETTKLTLSQTFEDGQMTAECSGTVSDIENITWVVGSETRIINLEVPLQTGENVLLEERPGMTVTLVRDDSVKCGIDVLSQMIVKSMKHFEGFMFACYAGAVNFADLDTFEESEEDRSNSYVHPTYVAQRPELTVTESKGGVLKAKCAGYVGSTGILTLVLNKDGKREAWRLSYNSGLLGTLPDFIRSKSITPKTTYNEDQGARIEAVTEIDKAKATEGAKTSLLTCYSSNVTDLQALGDRPAAKLKASKTKNLLDVIASVEEKGVTPGGKDNNGSSLPGGGTKGKKRPGTGAPKDDKSPLGVLLAIFGLLVLLAVIFSIVMYKRKENSKSDNGLASGLAPRPMARKARVVRVDPKPTVTDPSYVVCVKLKRSSCRIEIFPEDKSKRKDAFSHKRRHAVIKTPSEASGIFRLMHNMKYMQMHE